jgi:hypothetical protein
VTENTSILTELAGRSGEKPPVAGDVAERLRAGQTALTRRWLQLQDLEDWTEKQETLFWLNYDKWDRMERQARESGRIAGCPIGPDGCHKDAPIRCGHCAGGNVVHTPDMPADSKDGQAALFSLGGGRH